jgi:hypothetical protein
VDSTGVFPCPHHHSTMVLHAHVSSAGSISPLVAEVQRGSLIHRDDHDDNDDHHHQQQQLSLIKKTVIFNCKR